MSKIWRELETGSYVSVSLRNLEELSEKEPGLFVANPQVQPGDAATPPNGGAGKNPSSESPEAHSVPPLEPAEPEIDVEALEKKAYQKGVAAGKKEVEEKLAKATKALNEAAKKLSTQSESIMQRSAEDMLQLVMAIAERILHFEISERKEVVVRIVQQTINAAVQAEEFHIRVNPEDIEVLNEQKPLFIASLSGLSNIEFIADASITRGGCILESPSGRVDATLETQLDEIFTHLKETMVYSE
ncbi:MAG: FliH/SctL family protein [Thermodesulfobacteriota bacterium]